MSDEDEYEALSPNAGLGVRRSPHIQLANGHNFLNLIFLAPL